jgi:hypothetical protein
MAYDHRLATATIFVTILAVVYGHGAMVTPAPRASHNQILDANNDYGCNSAPGGCYSKAGFYPGEYAGVGCIGEACLYYQIGCFQGCSTCSLAGVNGTAKKDLYVSDADLISSGCPVKVDMPAPTLGGGNPVKEHALRTHNPDNASPMGDWTRFNPWRSPGTTGRANSMFQPCGVNSGSKLPQPAGLPPAAGQLAGANGTDLPVLTSGSQATWESGSVVEAGWAIYANHGGGYAYRLCKKVDGQELTEECFQQTHLNFATDTTEVRRTKSNASVFINATTTSVGTYPAGSQWRRNPVPMCNCDQGIRCQGASASARALLGGKGGKGTQAQAYPNAYGVHDERCPTGVQFEPLFDLGYGTGLAPHTLDFTMVDKLQLPELEAGEYSLSWRWDCEETPQVWNSCADVLITDAMSPSPL